MKKNMQFRMKIFLILMESIQLSTRELFDIYLNQNPKSVPAFNRFCQMLRCKWFENLGIIESCSGGQRSRVAIWCIRDEYRQYPPQWTPSSGAMLHHGGRINYPQTHADDYLPIATIATVARKEAPTGNIFDEYDEQLGL